MAGFRNLIVHDYAKIDDEIVYGILKKRLGDFDAYAETIRIYLIGSIEARCLTYILDARTATPHFPGIGRYVTNLARALVPLLTPDERLTVLLRPGLPDQPAAVGRRSYDPARCLAVFAAPAMDHPAPAAQFRMSAEWAVQLPAPSFQLPVSTTAHTSRCPTCPGVPSLLTVYDLIPVRYPAHSTARARLFIRWMTRLALRAARHVIAISEFTRRDFMAEFGLRPEQITAIPLAADPAFQPQPPEAIAAVRARYDLPERFVLYLGSNKPHKNLTRLVEAWQMANQRIANSEWQTASRELQIADTRLVIAGAWDERYPEARELANTSGAKASPENAELPASSNQLPIWLGPVPEADLPALYSARRRPSSSRRSTRALACPCWRRWRAARR